MTQPLLNIVVALHAEAKPLIEYFRLKKMSDIALPFNIFVNENKTIHLIIAGVGKIKTAAATAFLYVWTGSKSYSCFLNVGIAGSSQFSIGECVLANKIIENSTNRAWYPFTAALKFKKQSLVITHDSPQKTYPENGMLDMEASAFIQTASFFVTQEHIQVLKIISDCDIHSQNQLNRDVVKRLMLENISYIVELSKYLMNLSQQENKLIADPEKFTAFQEYWHFTYTQSIQLREFLRRWQIQLKDEDPLLFCKNEKSAAHAINKLIKKLDEHANSIY